MGFGLMKKKYTVYDTPAFRNRMEIERLNEKLERNKERKEIKELKRKVSGTSRFSLRSSLNSLYGKGGTLEGLYHGSARDNLRAGLYGAPLPKATPKKATHKHKVRTRVVYKYITK